MAARAVLTVAEGCVLLALSEKAVRVAQTVPLICIAMVAVVNAMHRAMVATEPVPLLATLVQTATSTTTAFALSAPFAVTRNGRKRRVGPPMTNLRIVFACPVRKTIANQDVQIQRGFAMHARRDSTALARSAFRVQSAVSTNGCCKTVKTLGMKAPIGCARRARTATVHPSVLMEPGFAILAPLATTAAVTIASPALLNVTQTVGRSTTARMVETKVRIACATLAQATTAPQSAQTRPASAYPVQSNTTVLVTPVYRATLRVRRTNGRNSVAKTVVKHKTACASRVQVKTALANARMVRESAPHVLRSTTEMAQLAWPAVTNVERTNGNSTHVKTPQTVVLAKRKIECAIVVPAATARRNVATTPACASHVPMSTVGSVTNAWRARNRAQQTSTKCSVVRRAARTKTVSAGRVAIRVPQAARMAPACVTLVLLTTTGLVMPVSRALPSVALMSGRSSPVSKTRKLKIEYVTLVPMETVLANVRTALASAPHVRPSFIGSVTIVSPANHLAQQTSGKNEAAKKAVSFKTEFVTLAVRTIALLNVPTIPGSATRARASTTATVQSA